MKALLAILAVGFIVWRIVAATVTASRRQAQKEAEYLGAAVFTGCRKAQLYRLLSAALSFDKAPSDEEWSQTCDETPFVPLPIEPELYALKERLHWQAYARLDIGWQGPPFKHELPWVCTAKEDRELNVILQQTFDDLATDAGDALRFAPAAAQFASQCLEEAVQRAGCRLPTG